MADEDDIGSSEHDDEGFTPTPAPHPTPRRKPAPPSKTVDIGSSEHDDEGYGVSNPLNKLGAGKPYGSSR